MFFSKYFTEKYPNKYNYSINQALSASIQRPNYIKDYDPTDEVQFIDMILGRHKNPSMNAYMMAKQLPLNGSMHDNIRVLSLSANDNNYKSESFIKMDALS